MFGLSAKGLGCREDDVLGQGVVDADAPGFDVIQDAVITPGVGRTAEERALVGVDVFDPGIPGAAGIAGSRTVGQFADPYFRIIGNVIIDFFIVSQGVPFAEVEAGISPPEIISFKTVNTIEIIIVDADSRTSCPAAAEEAFQFAITGFNTKKSIAFNCSIFNSITGFEFTITSRSCEVVVGVFQFSPVKDVAILEAVSVFTAQDVRIGTADAEVPMVAAEVVVDFGIVREDVAVIAGSAVIGEVDVIRADAVGYGRAVIDLGIGPDADAVILGSVFLIACAGLAAGVLMLETDTGITAEFYVAHAVFQGTDADAEVVQFVSIFISQFVDEGALFNGRFVHVSHGFGDHFSGFVTGDVAFALEIRAVYALDDAGVSEFDDGFISPAVARYVDEGVGCKSAGCADSHHSG